MPYATPSHQSPIPPSYGRPGHRRSYSHITLPSHSPSPSSASSPPPYPTPSTSNSTSTSPAQHASAFAFSSTPMASLPRRRSASASAGSVSGTSLSTTTSTTSTTNGSGGSENNGTQQQQQQPPTPRKTTFQLGREDDDDDDDDSSGSDERRPKPKPTNTSSSSNINKNAEDDEEDDILRRLPPLRLKPKGTSSFDALAVPFPRSSPRNSPRSSPLHSPVGSRDGMAGPPRGVYPHAHPHPLPQAMHTRSASEQPLPITQPPPHAHAHQPHHTHPRPPPVSRTYSSPILLSNGKPLKSSLKSSSSSPTVNVPFPFPSQSVLPSVLWPDLHRRVGTLSTPTPSPHQRAASAPSTPHLGSVVMIAQGGSTTAEADGALLSPDAPPSLTSSISSLSSSTSTSTTSTSSPSSSPPLSPSLPSLSPSLSISSHYSHPPKNVHFPSQETDIATVKIFNRSARPAALSLTGRESGNESQTETETEGEGSGTGGGFGGFAGGRWGSWGGSTWGKFGRGAVGSVSAGAGGGGGAGAGAGTTSGFPFPKVGAVRRSHSPLSNGNGALDADNDDGAGGGGNVREFYDIDEERCSYIPMWNGSTAGAEGVAGNGHRVGEGHVYVESVGFVRSVDGFGSGGNGPSNPSAIKTQPPSRPLTLTGTILVRNLAYRKTVAVRFTMDEWHTTNDVLASYECSLSTLPERFLVTRGNVKVGLPWGLEVSAPADGAAGSRRQGEQVERGKEGWDRFRFSINLEDYASSGTLEGRTMWFVGRYTAGVDVLVAASSATSSFAPSAAMSGLAGGNSSDALKDLAVAPGQGQEWWDNNAGRNYRIGFKKLARAPETRARVQGHVSSGSEVYKRGITFSAPSAYSGATSSPPPTQGSKAYPAPPQISSSVSFPGYASASDPYSPTTPTSTPTPQQIQQHKEHQAALTQSTLARLKKLNLRNYAAPAGYQKFTPPSADAPGSNDGVRVVLPGDDDEHVHAHDHGHAHDEVDNDRTPTVGNGVFPPSWGAGGTTKTADFGTTITLRSPPLSASKNVDIAIAIANGNSNGNSSTDKGGYAGGPSPSELGTSPPFSAMEDMGLGMGMGLGMRVPASRVLGGSNPHPPGNDEGYWPWSSFGDVPATTPPRVGEEKAGDDTLSAPVEDILMDIKERSTTPTAGSSLSSTAGSGSPGSYAASGALAVLPHRRRKTSHGEPKPAFSIGARSSSSSNSSSSSPSSSDTNTTKSKPDTNGNGNGNGIIFPGPSRRAISPVNVNTTTASPSSTATSTASAVKQNNGSGPAMWGLRPGSPRPSPSSSSSALNPSSAHAQRARFGAGGTRSPLRVSPLGSPSLSPSGSTTTITTTSSSATGSNSSPLANPPTTTAPGPTSPGGTTHDAVYQAFVRQWCFAQAPGPTVGSSSAANGHGHGNGVGGGDLKAEGAGGRGAEREGPRVVV